MITLAYINFWKDPTNDSYFTNFINDNIDQVMVVEPHECPDILIASHGRHKQSNTRQLKM